MRNIRLTLMALLGLCILVGFTPTARADSVVLFACQSVTPSSTPCTGSATISSGNVSTTGIILFNQTGQYSISTPFKVVFDTNAGTISITQQSGGTDTLTGKITGFSLGPASFGTGLDTLSMNVSWTSLPAAVCAASGASAPCPGVSVFDTVTFQIGDSGTVEVVHIGLQPIPEPATLSLFGSGLLALGGLLRKKLRS